MKTKSIITAIILTLNVQLSLSQVGLSAGFCHPQDSARTKVWWFHGETVATHEGITADLEAFKEKGVGGVVYYDQVHGKGEEAFKVFAPEWWDELIFSSKEARRIGLDFECNASNGYVAGGRWITPEKSMQRLATTELLVDGGRDVRVKLPMAKTPGGWYKDVAVMAIPYDEQTLGDSRTVFSPDSVVTVTDPNINKVIDIDFGHEFTARSITYITNGRGKARTSSMQVPPFSPRVEMKKGVNTEWDFFGCGFMKLPPIGELQVSNDGINYRTICPLRPKYQNLGGVKEQTVAFPTTKGRYFRITLHDWGTANKGNQKLTFGNVVLSARALVDAWQEKASLVSELIEKDNTPNYMPQELADFSRAIDLTGKTTEDGTLVWQDAPKGKWLVVRFFSMSNGGHTKHGRAEALGLECDKLSVEGARLQWKSYVKPIIDSIRSNGGLLTGICMDSHEAGPQNWTVGMESEFQHLRGYDLMPYLPVMAGFVVGSAKKSDNILHDLRLTINDLITERYFGEFNRLCRNEGLKLTAQAIGGALCMAGDAISVKRLVDKPQAEFWGYQTEGNYDIKDCSSAAHIYGKQIASGEAYTDITYKQTLADTKNLADYAYAFGINEFVVCAVAYQPWLDHRINTANGRQYVLNRHNTFWPHSRPFWDYQARCSWMLRQGKPVSDICIYLGDEIPMRILSHRLPQLPQGYDFDAFTTDALMNRMSVRDGQIVLPDGVSYKIMILPVDVKLTEKSRDRIETLRRQGARIINLNSGKVNLGQALKDAGITPDLHVPTARKLYFCHRRTDNEDIYFINNHSDSGIKDRFVFNTEAKNVELWHPVTGKRMALASNSEDGRTAINLNMAPRESYFVVFSNDKESQAEAHTPNDYIPASAEISITSPWTVEFDPQMGGPSESVVFAKLTDWTKHEDKRVRYFSGTAIARTELNVRKIDKKSNYIMSLPLLNTTAEVIVNGRSAGIVWCSPYEIDITGMMKKGSNKIELRMCNSLWNRLAGDANEMENERVMWQTHPLAKSTDPLVPSGLSGDVTISVR